VKFRNAIHAGAVALVVSGCIVGCAARPLPTDASLRSRFERHRSEFDSLATIARADSQLVGAGHEPTGFDVFVRDTSAYHHRLTDDETRATGRLALSRLLERAGVPSIARAADGASIRFVVAVSGGLRKGIVCSDQPLEPVRASLDGPEPGGAGYVPLAPRWFLFVELAD